MRESVQRFLRLRPFPPPSPPGVASLCSMASAVLRANPTSPPFPAQDYGIQPFLSRRARVAPARWRSPSFRAVDFPACAGSSTARELLQLANDRFRLLGALVFQPQGKELSS